jgi:hypothetical protein
VTNDNLSPESVLAAAFGEHDFIGQIDGREITIQTSEPFTEDEFTLIEVDAMSNPIGDGEAVTYRYRITFDRVVTDEERAAAQALA